MATLRPLYSYSHERRAHWQNGVCSIGCHIFYSPRMSTWQTATKNLR